MVDVALKERSVYAKNTTSEERRVIVDFAVGVLAWCLRIATIDSSSVFLRFVVVNIAMEERGISNIINSTS
jgi:hypothetical protein